MNRLNFLKIPIHKLILEYIERQVHLFQEGLAFYLSIPMPMGEYYMETPLLYD